ncbi:MAG: DUF1175 family protein [Terracidiphilus sp.]
MRERVGLRAERLWLVAGAVAIAALLATLPRAERRLRHLMLPAKPAVARALREQSPAWTDRFGDGTPDFLRLTDPSDQAAFRRWFTAIAAFQAMRPRAEVPAEIVDCASLLRYSYREALGRHDGQWFQATGMEVAAPPGEIGEWHYPDSPLGLGLFRVKPGPLAAADAANGAFAQFADAKTLVERNAYLVSRDVRAALPGDLLFWRQFGQSSPWHSMIVLDGGEVVYDTGPDHGKPGELRRVRIAELMAHPDARWRPVARNPNFLGVYRWNILRGSQ